MSTTTAARPATWPVGKPRTTPKQMAGWVPFPPVLENEAVTEFALDGTGPVFA